MLGAALTFSPPAASLFPVAVALRMTIAVCTVLVMAILPVVGVVLLRFQLTAVEWDGEAVELCIGIAAKGDEHGELLGNLAEKLLDPSSYKTLMETTSTTELLGLINL